MSPVRPFKFCFCRNEFIKIERKIIIILSLMPEEIYYVDVTMNYICMYTVKFHSKRLLVQAVYANLSHRRYM